MRVMFAGDTHSNIGHWERLCKIAKKERVEAIVQMGDLEYSENTMEGRAHLNAINDMLPCPMYFLDGNHEDHDELDRLDRVTFAAVRNNISYIHRGAAWHWAGVNFLALGGAFSYDYKWRKKQEELGKRKCWWPQEVISEEDLGAALVSASVLPPDIMLTHDAPDGAPMTELTRLTLTPETEKMAKENREKIRTVADAAKPRFLIHGHYHKRIAYNVDLTDGTPMEVHGLACDPESINKNVTPDTTSDSYLIINLKDFPMNRSEA